MVRVERLVLSEFSLTRILDIYFKPISGRDHVHFLKGFKPQMLILELLQFVWQLYKPLLWRFYRCFGQ